MTPYWDAYNVIICRYTEVGLKSDKVRTRMEYRLIDHIKLICKREQLQLLSVLRLGGRIIYFFPHEKLLPAISVFRHIVGVYSFSPGFSMKRDYNEVQRVTLEFADQFLNDGDSFALRVKRIQPYPKESTAIERELGGLIVDTMKDHGKNIRVDLTHANKRIFLEIREKGAYLYTEIIPTIWGGNPIESDKALLSPVTSDINSIIAAQLLIRRGTFVTPIVFEGLPASISEERAKIPQFLHLLAMDTATSLPTVYLNCTSLLSALNEVEKSHPKINSSQKVLFGIYLFFKLIDRLLSHLNTNKLITHLEYALWLKGIITPIHPSLTMIFEMSQKFTFIHLNPIASFNPAMIQALGEKIVQTSIASEYSQVLQWSHEAPTSLADILLTNLTPPLESPNVLGEVSLNSIVNLIPFIPIDQYSLSVLQNHIEAQDFQYIEKIFNELEFEKRINQMLNQLRIQNIAGNIL